MQMSALVVGALGFLQLMLGGFLISSPGGMNSVHNFMGLLTIGATAFAAVAAYNWRKEGGNPGLFPHAAGMLVVAIIQFAIGEALVRTVHIILGFVFVAGALALTSLAMRKPFAKGTAKP